MPISASSEHRIVFCTCPDLAQAKRIAEELVTKKLAACANILPGLTSIYKWEGKITHDDECLLILKTRRDVLNTLSETIQSLHAYELPEVVAVSISEGLTGYLNWIDESLEK